MRLIFEDSHNIQNERNIYEKMVSGANGILTAYTQLGIEKSKQY